MNPFLRCGGFVVLFVLVIFLTHSALGQKPPAWESSLAWKDASVGQSAPAGKHEWNEKDGLLTLTGGGLGLNERELDWGDQFHFTSIARSAGDFEIIVRLASFTGPEGATAGIMVRPAEGDGPTAAMTSVYYLGKDRDRRRASDNAVGWLARMGPPPRARMSAGGIGLAKPGPADSEALWMRMVRVGDKFAVYKSRDGRLWSMISNGSGGSWGANGPLRVGVFCAAGAADKTASATFDSIRIGDPHLAYRTSMVGNSGGDLKDNHVANTASAMWVAPDGTCYTSSYWDEVGHPVKAYRDGKVLHALPIGTPQTAQGGITGDGKRLYVATVNTITELDPAAADRGFSPRVLVLSIPLLDQETHHSVVSGMASDGKELFVADQREHLIRVVTLATPATGYSPAESNNVRTPLATTPVVVPQGSNANVNKKFAPAVVYQSQRAGEGVTYNLPNLTPNAVYTIRCHMAEFVKRREDADDRNRFVSIGGGSEHAPRVYVAREAGGENIALVKDFPNFKTGDNGTLKFHFATYGGPGLCGFEVLDGDGKRVQAVNCGGPDAGDFKGESPELLDRNFAFQNPGVMTFDKRGHLWIIQRDVQGIKGKPDTKGAVKCYTTDGKFTGREITDVVNPNALGYDAANDQLLVGVNVPDVNVRFYSNLDTQPKLARTFGEKGGIYAGKNPGLIYDPAAGEYARFAGINGLGVDAKGNLYVGGGWQGSDIRMFTPDGKLGWMLNSLLFCNTYDVDPASDGEDIYGTYNHVKLDLTKTVPGSEQTYVGYNWDWRRFGEPVRQSNSQAMLHRMGPDKRLILFTSGQGHMGDILMFRYEGELAIPCGAIRENSLLWIDADGDGKESDNEVVKMDGAGISGLTALCVDSRGDLWIGVPTTNGSFMRQYFFKGMNEHGGPVYGAKEGEDFKDIRFPDEGGTTNARHMRVRLDYDANRDIMILYYPCVPRAEGDDDRSPPRYKLARYDNWSKGNRDATWKIDGLTPYDPEQAEFFMYETGLYPYACHMGMQFVGEYVFFAHMFGEVHVHDAATGKLVEILSIGPEMAGHCAWEDASMGLRAFKRKNGEYLIFTENSGWAGKNNMFRWTPEKK